MALPTSTEFLTRFPEFGEQSEAVVSGALAEAIRFCPQVGWKKGVEPTVRFDAISYLTAHILATRTVQIGTQVGSVSGTPWTQGIDSTLYGQEYRRLLDSLPICGFMF